MQPPCKPQEEVIGQRNNERERSPHSHSSPPPSLSLGERTEPEHAVQG